MSFVQVVCLGVNTIVLCYYGAKYMKIRSFYNKTEKATAILTIDYATLSALVGKYVVVSGRIKALAETIPSKYATALSGVAQQIQTVKHQIIRIAGFWIRKKEIINVVSLETVPFALVNSLDDAEKLEILVKNPLSALKKTAAADLFTGYKNVSWPVSNIIHDRFVLNQESTNPFRILLCGAHDMGIQETESLILDGGYITAVGYLKESNGSYSVVPEILTSCDHNMLLKKVSDLRQEVVWKLIVFGTIGAILCLVMCRRKKRAADTDDVDWNR